MQIPFHSHCTEQQSSSQEQEPSQQRVKKQSLFPIPITSGYEGKEYFMFSRMLGGEKMRGGKENNLLSHQLLTLLQ